MGCQNSETREPIYKKFGVGDYVSEITPHAKIQHGARGWNSTLTWCLFFFSFFVTRHFAHAESQNHTHTHPFKGPFSGTTRVSRYQKGKTNLDFTEARDSEWQWHQLGHMQVCNLLQTDNHASTPPHFLQAGCPSCCPNNSVKALKALRVCWCAGHNHELCKNDWTTEHHSITQKHILCLWHD